MRATYRYTFSAVCPVDGSRDIYRLEVVANRLIPVEDIIAAVRTSTQSPSYQEEVTSAISRELGPTFSVTTTGVHSGIETVVEC